LNLILADKPGDTSSKYLMKMKRQERVIEEVKLVIKPYYSKRTINKDQYKEILRKAVPKVMEMFLQCRRESPLTDKIFFLFLDLSQSRDQPTENQSLD
jgi:hypothetical protein